MTFLRGVRPRHRSIVSQLVLVGVLTLLIGEAYMRMPFVLPPLEYRADGELGGRLAGNQVGYLWLANMSLKSRPITLNPDGHRGEATDWSHPVVLALGDSEWFGAGVDDSDVWTAVLERALRSDPRLSGLSVVNASHPGHGPYHEYVVARRLLAAHDVEALLVRVAIGQRYFKPVPVEQQAQLVRAAERRAIVRRVTKFGPFLYNKVEAQLPSIRAAMRPHFLAAGGGAGDGAAPVDVGRAMAREARTWWDQLADLATARQIPVVFVVHDIEDRPSARALEETLRAVASSHRGVYVVRLGPEAFGLERIGPAERPRVIRERLTLGRDPHANVEQHRLIASEILRYLRQTELTEAIERHARARRGAPLAAAPPR